MADDNINFQINRRHFNYLTNGLKTIVYVGGMYAFMFHLIPDLVDNKTAGSDIGSYAYESDWENEFIPGEACSMESGSGACAVDADLLERRVNTLFPELEGQFSVTDLNASGLATVEAAALDLTFLISRDGNYLITDAYFDLSAVNDSADAENMRAVQLSASPNSRPSVQYSNEQADDSSEITTSEAFEWAIDNTNIVYEATTEESIGDIVVFADYTCPECRKFHDSYYSLQEKGYNLHVALLNRNGNSGRVFENTRAIQCSDDPKGNYEVAITTRSVNLGAAPADCEAPAADYYDMAIYFMSQEMERPGTPGIWVNGERFVNRMEALRL